MSEQKTFLLRIDANVLDALRTWAADELRSVNGQIEYVLRQALKAEGRLRLSPPQPPPSDSPPDEV
jgi:hypothetical protein